MNRTAWSKLLDLLRSLIRSRCRTQAEANRLEAQLEEIRREVYRDDE